MRFRRRWLILGTLSVAGSPVWPSCEGVGGSGLFWFADGDCVPCLEGDKMDSGAELDGEEVEI